MRSAKYATYLVSALLIGLASSACLGEAQDQLDRGRTAWKAREYASALAILKEIENPGSNPEVLQLMGECYKGLKDWPQAIKSFERILDCKTSQFPPQDVKSWIMDCYLAGDQPREALSRLEKLVAEYPNDAPKFRYLLGRRYQWMWKWAEGAKQFEQALKMPRTDPLAREIAVRYICCSLSGGDPDTALAYLPTFIKDYPDGVPEILTAQFARWKFKIPQATQVAEKVMAESSGDAKLQIKTGLADCYALTRDWAKAEELLASVPEDFRKRSAQWHVVTAKCYWGRVKYAEAMAALNDALTIKATPEARKLLMEYQREATDYKNLLVTLSILRKEQPDNTSEWLLNEGWAYLDMKQDQKAIPIFREAIARFPNERWIVRAAQVSLAECLFRTGKGEQALADLKAYYSARPDLGCEYQLLYAQVMYYGAKDYPAAIAGLDKVVSNCPGDPLANDARDFLVRALGSAGRSEEAAALLEANTANLPVWNAWDRGKSLRQAADIYFDAKNYQKAAQNYALLAESKSSPKEERAAATYRLAMCKYQMKDTDSAVRLMKSVIADYPDTTAAREAKAQLEVWTLFGTNQ